METSQELDDKDGDGHQNGVTNMSNGYTQDQQRGCSKQKGYGVDTAQDDRRSLESDDSEDSDYSDDSDNPKLKYSYTMQQKRGTILRGMTRLDD